MKNLRPQELNKPRKRRLRKKLRVGEFQEFGFELKFIINQAASITFDSALDAWIDFVEFQGWAFGGGGNIDGKEIDGFLANYGRGTLKEKDRLSVEEWLNSKEWVEAYQIGELKDAWHGW
ncbi:MAG: DUF469 family protein [Desulfobacterales bacterium]|nr:DUF469 family protein [Desulfobacterales bacterium]